MLKGQQYEEHSGDSSADLGAEQAARGHGTELESRGVWTTNCIRITCVFF